MNRDSRNPANDDSLPGAMRIVLQKYGQATDDMLPVRVVAYDRAANRARVEHQIDMITTSGERISRGQVASIPVLALGGGGFFINFHLPEGALGWIKASDRDISLFLQNYQKSPPNDGRIHDFSSGLLIPDVMTGYTIDPEDEQAMVIQNLDGSVKLSFKESEIKARVGGVDVLTLTDSAATFGVNIVDQNGVIHDTHRHSQGNDSDGNSQVNTNGPQN